MKYLQIEMNTNPPRTIILHDWHITASRLVKGFEVNLSNSKDTQIDKEITRIPFEAIYLMRETD